MPSVPMTARLRCRNKSCRERVLLSDDHVRQLSRTLRVDAVCPRCQQPFVASLVPRVKEVPSPKLEDLPSLPVLSGAEQAAPPFKPLTAAPKIDSSPFDLTSVAPNATPPSPRPMMPFDPMPFSPIRPGQPPTSAGGGAGGWWNRQPKRTQHLILVVGLLFAGLFAFVIKSRGKTAEAESVAVEPQPSTAQRPASQADSPKPNPTVTTADDDDDDDETPAEVVPHSRNTEPASTSNPRR